MLRHRSTDRYSPIQRINHPIIPHNQVGILRVKLLDKLPVVQPTRVAKRPAPVRSTSPLRGVNLATVETFEARSAVTTAWVAYDTVIDGCLWFLGYFTSTLLFLLSRTLLSPLRVLSTCFNAFPFPLLDFPVPIQIGDSRGLLIPLEKAVSLPVEEVVPKRKP